MMLNSATLIPELSLVERIERAIQSRTGVRINDLRVLVDDQRVVVQGRTPTYYNKQLVTQAVFDACPGEPLHLQNEVEVISAR